MTVWDHGWWDEGGFAGALPALLDPMRMPYILSVLEPAHGGQRVLDVGCGGGATCARLADRGFQVVGVDPSPGAIAEASQADSVGLRGCSR